LEKGDEGADEGERAESGGQEHVCLLKRYLVDGL
jgi:hypothetical protein